MPHQPSLLLGHVAWGIPPGFPQFPYLLLQHWLESELSAEESGSLDKGSQPGPSWNPGAPTPDRTPIPAARPRGAQAPSLGRAALPLSLSPRQVLVFSCSKFPVPGKAFPDF